MTTIFLAEDDEAMVSLLEILLKMEGFNVEKIDTSEKDILSSLRKAKPEILLLDVNLPHINGIDIVHQMREEKIFENTKVIMASGSSVEEKCRANGADDFLLKPYMPDDLIAIIKKYAD